MKNRIKQYFFFAVLQVLFATNLSGQTVTGPSGYKVVNLGDNGHGDYTQSLILLHEAYNGTLLPFNNVVGTITAFRGHEGAFNRMSVASVNTSAAYTATLGTIQSLSEDAAWRLKTCIYNGKKYLAVEVPYSAAYHNWGYQFAGWSNSSGESLKCVNFKVNHQPVNQDLISDIQDFNSNVTETHSVRQMNVLGNMNIGTESPNPNYMLQVNGKMRAHEIKVETNNWPDYVFTKEYKLPTLQETEKHITDKGHLPGIPSAKEVEAEGINLGEMNAKLLQKIEELTLHLIEKERKDKQQQSELNQQKEALQKIIGQLEILEKKINRLEK